MKKPLKLGRLAIMLIVNLVVITIALAIVIPILLVEFPSLQNVWPKTAFTKKATDKLKDPNSWEEASFVFPKDESALPSNLSKGTRGNKNTEDKKGLSDSISTSPSWWQSKIVAADITLILKAINQKEFSRDQIFRANKIHPDRITFENLFVEISKNGEVRVGNLSIGKQVVGLTDGSFPKIGWQNVNPNDRDGYAIRVIEWEREPDERWKRSAFDFYQRTIHDIAEKIRNSKK